MVMRVGDGLIICFFFVLCYKEDDMVDMGLNVIFVVGVEVFNVL